ncbi:PepSY domain-containing protein [Virgibacillus proomii]|uniref:PepSY domain-containing protein n=1 Tax=Virgibacillus proomii TaxID=84407 RepID=UPI001C1232F8|nr:PepSY domain-containing protein [Virgibacillus proomii]MBU5268131.1 PepSY domain-containing protein [Virgibacillus proomii]
MNKKTGVILACIIGLALIGFSVFYFGSTSSSAEITKVEAKDIISSQYPGKIKGDVEKDEKSGYYYALIDHEGKIFEIKINEKTGEVMNLRELSAPDKKKDKQDKQPKDVQDPTEKDNMIKDKDKNNSEELKVVVHEEQAKELALKEFAGTIEDFELEEEDGSFVYEVKVVNGEDEAEITIDAFTGEILFTEIEREDD